MSTNINHDKPMRAVSEDARSKRFLYTCNRCLYCCNDKIIQLNPYEIARLASGFNISTAEFSKNYTVDGQGTILAQADNGDCIFLGPAGCRVHPNRPLVCRLYPLGRHVSPDAQETFSTLDPHPLSQGVYSDSGTIAEYLESQGAYPYMDAADDYYFWLCNVQSILENNQSVNEDEHTIPYDNLLDIDSVIHEYSVRNYITPPDDIEDRKRLHLDILYTIISQLEGESE